MKKSVMKKWVAALRSGEYTQTQMALKSNGSYCCLGVLCKVVGEKFDSNERCLNEGTLLPSKVQKKSGLKSNDGSRPGKRDLANLNDEGYSFKKIAAIIEKEYKDL